MRWNPKTGALDRQAGVPRVALRFSTTRNPASISFNYPTRGESIWQVQRGSETRLNAILLPLYCIKLRDQKPRIARRADLPSRVDSDG
jgi:hypothetical protein